MSISSPRESTPTRYQWVPIEDLAVGHRTLASQELPALSRVWAEQKEGIGAGEPLKQFNERLQRQWAIETGIIERVYTLDRGITQVLIERGIDASLIPGDATDKDPRLVAQIIRDQEEAIEGIFDFVKGHRSLSNSYIKALHALLLRHQERVPGVDTLGRKVEVPLVRGKYKTLPNNPVRPDGSIHEYSPPEQVDSEMDTLLQLHGDHEKGGVAPEVEAAWFHHRFSQIHPFQDGNGRMARSLATLILIKAGYFPLVVTRDDRTRYIDALEAADRGDLGPLVNLFVAIERRAFVNALSVAGEVLKQQRVDQVIDAARDLFERRQEALRREWQQAMSNAANLQEVAANRFKAVAERLQDEIGHYSRDYWFNVDSEPDGGARSHWFRFQVIETAKAIGYFANPSVYRSWLRLMITTETRAEILLSIHGIGHEFRGVLAASMCFFRRQDAGDAEREIADVQPVTTEVFQINYQEDAEQARQRFETWLDEGLVRGLEVWRKGL